MTRTRRDSMGDTGETMRKGKQKSYKTKSLLNTCTVLGQKGFNTNFSQWIERDYF